MARRNDIDWQTIRTEYEQGIPRAQLARKHGVSDMQIFRRSKDEGWVGGRIGRLKYAAEVRERVIDTAAKRVIEDARIEDAIVEIGASLSLHPIVAKELMETAREMLRRFRNNEITAGPTQSDADVFDKVLSGIEKAFRISREINGLDRGRKSLAESSDENAKVDQAILVVRERVPAAEAS